MLAVVLVGAVFLIGKDADDLAAAIGEIGLWRLLASAVLAVLATLAIAMIWLCILRGSGLAVETRGGGAIFFVTQLGKYVPGSIWPIVAQGAAGRRWGASPRQMVLVNLVMLALLCVTGLLTGVLLLPWAVEAPWASAWWLLTLPLLMPFLHPAVIPAVLGRLVGLVGKEPFDRSISARAMLMASAWCLVAWALLGLHLWVLLSSMDRVGGSGLAAMIGAIALGWAVGLVVVVAPAGAGVRDGIVIAAAATFVDTSQAAAVALASRVVLVLVDVLLAGAGAVFGVAGASAASARRDED
ncbi:lysylphosphatidylglycerol synthase domain-containing protein [Nocardioides bigeumensis]|uniref:Lysylphosphatidylglycerol synthase transmembrane domain-containing protein n=1 Tax=Nocardioides bigeumensis TaxID=433657 RepID=A0ABN2XSD0_9ACTN